MNVLCCENISCNCMTLKMWNVLTPDQKKHILHTEDNDEIANNIVNVIVMYMIQKPQNINLLPLINYINKDKELCMTVLSVIFLKKQSFYNKTYPNLKIYIDENIKYFSSQNAEYANVLVNMYYSKNTIEKNDDMYRLVEQSSLELFADHMYYTFANEKHEHLGIKKWFHLQSIEEGIHFQWIIQYVIDNDLVKSFLEHITLFELHINKDLNNLEIGEMLEISYAWEVTLTKYINETKTLTDNVKLKSLMDVFIVEQEEEETNFNELIKIYNNESIETLNYEMGKRGGDEC